MAKWDLFQVWKAGSAFNNELCNLSYQQAEEEKS